MTRLADQARVTPPATRSVERRLKITVLSGGPSGEREVSLKSGRAIADALASLGHGIHLADIMPDSLGALDRPADLVFIALHGCFGEDGQIQRILDQRGIRYCGSGAASSALAMDKVATKCRFIETEVPTPRFDVVFPQRLEQIVRTWAPPVVLKPVDEGSSLDCLLIREPGELAPKLKALLDRHGRCMIEAYIDGPELTVGILGDEALPPIEIRTRRAFYDYQAKYIDEDTEYLFDINLPAHLLDEIRLLSLKAHRALDCRDFSRVDWRVDASSGRPYALEVNTIPGFTDHSLLPKAARRAGLSFPQLCQRIVDLACAR